MLLGLERIWFYLSGPPGPTFWCTPASAMSKLPIRHITTAAWSLFIQEELWNSLGLEMIGPII